MDSFDSKRRKVIKLIGIGSGSLVMPGLFMGCSKGVSSEKLFQTPHPLSRPKEGNISLEEAFNRRHSERDYSDVPLSFQQLSQIVWAAQGVNAPRYVSGAPTIGRTTPSAGALYPIELYLFVRNVDGLTPGLYRYDTDEHTLITLKDGDQSETLCSDGKVGCSILNAAVTVVIGGVIERTSSKYGSRAERYVAIEVGCVAQNIYLQAGALGLGTVFMGAFNDSGVKNVISDSKNDIVPFGVMPIGALLF